MLDENHNVDEACLKRVAFSVLLAFADGNFLVHSDLKKENVLVRLDQKGKLAEAKVADLGLVTSRDHWERRRRGVYSGTPVYSPPEQLHADDEHPYDARADMWSLGVLLFYLITGKFPFNGYREASDKEQDLSTLVDRISNEECPLEEIADDVSDELF